MAGAGALKDSALIEAFSAAYDEASRWCMEHPDETAKLAVKYVPQLKEEGVAEAMRHVGLKSVDALEAQEDLEDFYRVLLNSKPALVGGKIPDKGFYYHP
jgi:NitT/TauT family transport system substrate-binding protein